MSSLKIKIKILIVGLCVYLLMFYGNIKKLFSRKGQVLNSSVVLNYVVVHLDLKGAPPKLQYLESLLPKLKDNGVNGLLVEYEDMFPYEGKLINISAKNSYDRYQLKHFLTTSTRLGIEIIPLVQTFGHIEHALKLQEFRHLRELPNFPDSMCPNKAESIQLVKNMLEQVDLIVQELSPHTRVLIWDDMLRGQNGFKSTNIDLSNIEPVYWDYRPQLSVTHVDLLNYHKKFNNIWIASAFKGADGRSATIPNITNRFINNLSWLDFIANYRFGGESGVFNFKGIILTGWSRYSHMDPLCELLPVSIPSLMLNLLLIQTMKKGIAPADANNLNFSSFYIKYLETEFQKKYNCNKMSFINKTLNISTCTFDTSNLQGLHLTILGSPRSGTTPRGKI